MSIIASGVHRKEDCKLCYFLIYFQLPIGCDDTGCVGSQFSIVCRVVLRKKISSRERVNNPKAHYGSHLTKAECYCVRLAVDSWYYSRIVFLTQICVTLTKRVPISVLWLIPC